MMVVLVLTMSCQVSEKSKKGPLTSQIRMTPTASANAQDLPAQIVAPCAKRSNMDGCACIGKSVAGWWLCTVGTDDEVQTTKKKARGPPSGRRPITQKA